MSTREGTSGGPSEAVAGPAIGLFHGLSDVRPIELAGEAGFDFVVLDNEHRLRDPSELFLGIRVGAISGMPVLVRVSECSRSEIGSTLDSGAAGVVVPHVDSPEMAATAVSFARHAPEGVRGYGGPVAWERRVRPFSATAPDPAVVFIVESKRGVEAAAEIAAVEGAAAVLPGPGDLAKDLGVAPDDPVVRRHVERVVDAVHAASSASLMLMCTSGETEELQSALQRGAAFLAVGPDQLLMQRVIAGVQANWAKVQPGRAT